MFSTNRSFESLVVGSRLAAGVIGSVMGFASAGCGGKAPEPWELVHKASGKVLFQGKPIEGAQIILFPKDSSFPNAVRPSATTDFDGNFEIGTKSRDDGAPEGTYGVAVTWNPTVDVGGGAVRGPNKLPPKYSKPESSGLTVTIDATNPTLKTIELN